MLQITKAKNSLQAFSAFPVDVPIRPQNSIILEAGGSQWWHRWIPGPSHCQEDVKSPAPENTESSLEPGCDFQTKSDVNAIHHKQVFWAGSRCACSPRESPGMNFSAWPPSPASITRRSKCSWFSPAGMEDGVDFRNQVSSQPWTPGNQTLHHLPHLMPKSYSGPEGTMTCENLSCVFQTPLGVSRMPEYGNWRVCKEN